MARKTVALIMCLALLVSMLYVAKTDYDSLEEQDYSDSLKTNAAKAVDDDTIVVWYTDDALTEFLNDIALSYRNEKDVKIQFEKRDGIDYIEEINTNSISDYPRVAPPDLYITTHDTLMKAYLAGLAYKVTDPDSILNDSVFPETAIHAVRCNGELIAYPLFYETNFFLYNKTYMESIAESLISADTDSEIIAEGDSDSENSSDDAPDNEEDENAEPDIDGEEGADELSDPMGEEDSVADKALLEQLSKTIPSTLSEVTNFANNYDAPEMVEAVFKWDVTDIFYNYFFVGNYMEVGGEDGDNNAIFSLYNKQTVECLQAYQNMNKYFTIDTEKDTYDNILQEFIDGKLVFTVATTDAISKINAEKAKGNFKFEYGVTVLPDISDTLKARGLSVTDVIAVNGYSKKKEMANSFASYVSANSDSLYEKAGKLSCKKNVKYNDTEIAKVMPEYEKSMPLPKMIETSNFWLHLELAFSQIFNETSNDSDKVDEVVRNLQEQLVGQIDTITYSIPVQESITAGAGNIFN